MVSYVADEDGLKTIPIAKAERKKKKRKEERKKSERFTALLKDGH